MQRGSHDTRYMLVRGCDSFAFSDRRIYGRSISTAALADFVSLVLSLPTLWAVPLRPDCQEGMEGTEKRAKPPDAAGDLRRREGSN